MPEISGRVLAQLFIFDPFTSDPNTIFFGICPGIHLRLRYCHFGGRRWWREHPVFFFLVHFRPPFFDEFAFAVFVPEYHFRPPAIVMFFDGPETVLVFNILPRRRERDQRR